MQLQRYLMPTATSQGNYNLVIASGGTRALLAAVGSLSLCHLAGIRKWRSIGGISGGAIPAAFLANGMSAPELIHFALESDFSQFVEKKTALPGFLLAVLLKDYYEHNRNRPAKGVLDISKLDNLFAQKITNWPENFWTMANTGDSQIIFNAKGITEYTGDGRIIQLAQEPAPIGFAIRTSCTIPGIVDAYKLGDRYLYDGVHSRDGHCPVGVPIRYFGASPERTLGICVGEELSEGTIGVLRRFWRSLWGHGPEPRWGPETEGVIRFYPKVTHFHALKFNLSTDEKWLAIIRGYRSALLNLTYESVLRDPELQTALNLLRELESEPKLLLPAPLGQKQTLTKLAEQAFSKHGLY